MFRQLGGSRLAVFARWRRSCGSRILSANAQQSPSFIIGLTVKNFVLRFGKGHAHFIVVHLAEVIQVHTSDDAVVFIEIAFGVQILAKAGFDMLLTTQPLCFIGVQILLAIDDADLAFDR